MIRAWLVVAAAAALAAMIGMRSCTQQCCMTQEGCWFTGHATCL